MNDDSITKAKEYIALHLKDEFSLDDLAHFVGYSSYHFAREFKEATGMSAMEFVREKRIHAAAEDIRICERNYYHGKIKNRYTPHL